MAQRAEAAATFCARAPTTMPDYHLFGSVLRSDIELVELSPCTGLAPRWHLGRVDDGPPSSALEALGSEPVEAGVTVTLYRGDGFVRLAFDDTGSFDLSADGRHIRWLAPATPNLDSVRKDVLGRVFAVCLELEGTTTLHGSAVDIDGEGVAFLAPKFHGKSTTAAAIVDRGGRLLADDLVAVTAGAPPHVVPSVPVVQLWQDSAERVARIGASARGDGSSVKVQIGWDDSGRNATSSVAFTAAYLLDPFKPDGARGVKRERLPHVPATLALLGQTKVGRLLGPRWRASLLGRLANIAGHVPVYRLEVPRDYDRLDELTEALWSWHASELAGAGAGR